jgi:hypothetical protein
VSARKNVLDALLVALPFCGTCGEIFESAVFPIMTLPLQTLSTSDPDPRLACMVGSVLHYGAISAPLGKLAPGSVSATVR